MAKKKVEENQALSVEKSAEVMDNKSENSALVSDSHASLIEEESLEERSIAQKLLSLYHLQQIYSQVDKIRVLRGELPEEIQDLEDACEGMQTRISKYQEDIDDLKRKIVSEETKIKDSLALIKRYEEQQNNVRNNREYESLTKEIDYQKLEIQLSEKNRGKHTLEVETKTADITEIEQKLAELAGILEQKKGELSTIVAETEKEEAELIAKAEDLKLLVDERFLVAFERIRKNARNGLAIVQIERDACGGCFSTIPPQRQLDIRLHKKIIVCEACGRIFIDKQLVESDQQ
mgnify:CR=1 FL=1